MEQNFHDGHRDRLRERFLETGLNHFQPHETLELLLFYAIPRRNTSELAHALLHHFGNNLATVLDAPVEELERVEGMTHNAAVMITFCSQLLREYERSKYREPPKILDTTEKLKGLILPTLSRLSNESVMLICLDGKFKLLDSTILTTGSVNSSEITTRLILQRALLYNASIVVLSHNHPSGVALPSKADITTTIQLKRALALAEVRLWDHIVVGDNDMVSMRDTPTLEHIFM